MTENLQTDPATVAAVDAEAVERDALAALEEASSKLGDQPTPLIPWLQDYSSAFTYGVAEVQAQVDGAAAAGSCSWIMQDAENTYTPGITTAC